METETTIRKCSVTGCDRKHFALSYCTKHYQRFKKRGTPTPAYHGNTKTDVGIGYRAAHITVERVRGKARTYFCIDCDEQAAEWSLEPGTPDVLYSEAENSAGKAYSLDVYAYSPRCKSCHRKADGIDFAPGNRRNSQ